ncbi:unnamed protein product, partial [Lymnaea stagnalis]
NNAARERSRVKTLRSAFLELQRTLPAVPPNTKLSKLDVLVLATAYIYHLTKTLEGQEDSEEPQLTETDGVSAKGGFKHVSVSKLGRSNNVTLHSPYTPHGHHTLSSAPGHCVRMRRVQLSRRTSGSYHNSDLLLAKGGQSNEFEAHHEPILPLLPPEQQQLGETVPWRISNIERQRDRKSVKTHVPLNQGTVGILHPVKKWPMRSRLYDSILGCNSQWSTLSTSPPTCAMHINDQL